MSAGPMCALCNKYLLRMAHEDTERSEAPPSLSISFSVSLILLSIIFNALGISHAIAESAPFYPSECVRADHRVELQAPLNPDSPVTTDALNKLRDAILRLAHSQSLYFGRFIGTRKKIADARALYAVENAECPETCKGYLAFLDDKDNVEVVEFLHGVNLYFPSYYVVNRKFIYMPVSRGEPLVSFGFRKPGSGKLFLFFNSSFLQGESDKWSPAIVEMRAAVNAAKKCLNATSAERQK